MNSPSPHSLPPAFRILLPVIFIWITLVYMGSLDNGFVDWDDKAYILDNAMIRSLAPDHLLQMMVSLEPAYWHPVTWLSHAVDYQLFELNPAGHHFTSVLIHGVTVLWVFLLFRHVLSRACPAPGINLAILLGSAWAALMFGLHPLRVESVVWAAERKDLLCAFFMIPAMLTYLHYAEAQQPGARRRWYGITFLLFLLALMSKPMAVTLPVVMLILDGFPLRRWVDLARTRPLILEKVPFFVLSLVCGLVTIVAQESAGAVVPMEALSLGDRILNAIESAVFYMEKTLWPFSLAALYPFPDFDLGLAGKVLVFAGVTGTVVWMANRGKFSGLAGWLYYLVTLAPVSGVVQVGRQGAADRFTYIPTLSFYLLMGFGAVWMWQQLKTSRGQNRATGFSLAVGLSLLIALSLLTVRQIPVWKNSGTLWSQTVAVYPSQMGTAHFNLGRYLKTQGDSSAAIRQFRITLQINPQYREAYFEIGLIQLDRNRLDEAEAFFRSALAVQPDARVHNNLGLIFMKREQWQEAADWFGRALEIENSHPEAHNNLGLVYLQTGRVDEAEAAYRKAIQAKFEFASAHMNLGNLYKRQGRWGEALMEMQLGRYLEPGHPDIRVLLGQVYALTGDARKAELEFQEALRIDPHHAAAKDHLQKLRSRTVPQ